MKFSSGLKYSIVSPEEKYYFNKRKKEDKFANIYKNNSILFPRAVEKSNFSKMKIKKVKVNSKSYIDLPYLH